MYTALKAKLLEMRKARDPMSTFLITVHSKAVDLAKAENPHSPVPTDDHALRAINSFIKTAEDNIQLLQGQTDNPTYVRALEELSLLKSFLPEEVDDNTVEQFVRDYIAANPGDPKRMMGDVMKALNAEFGASLNKRNASRIVQGLLNS